MPCALHSEEDEIIKTQQLNIETSLFKHGRDVNVKVFPPFTQITNTRSATRIPFIFFSLGICTQKADRIKLDMHLLKFYNNIKGSTAFAVVQQNYFFEIHWAAFLLSLFFLSHCFVLVFFIHCRCPLFITHIHTSQEHNNSFSNILRIFFVTSARIASRNRMPFSVIYSLLSKQRDENCDCKKSM